MARIRIRVSAGTVQVAAVVGAAIIAGVPAANGGSTSAAAISYTTSAATVTTVTDRISATGTVQPASTLNLSFGTSSLPVTSVAVHPGQTVVAGQQLATMESTAAAAALASAEAQLAVAEAQANAAASPSPTPNTTTTRTTTTSTTTTRTTTTARVGSAAACTTGTGGRSGASPSPSPTVSPTPSTTPTPVSGPAATPTAAPTAKPTTATSTATASPCPSTSTGTATPARSASTSSGSSNGSPSGGESGGTTSLVSAQAAVSLAQATLAAATLTAPSDGVVQSVNLVVGTLPGSPAVVLRATGYQVVVDVAEQDAPYITVGQTGQASFTALGATAPVAVVQEPTVGSDASSAAGATVVSFPVTLAITGPPPGLLPGMSAQVSWTAATKTNVVAVPTGALRSGDTGDVVQVLVNGQPQTTAVSIGLSTTSLTEITSGLRAGDAVVTGTTG